MTQRKTQRKKRIERRIKISIRLFFMLALIAAVVVVSVKAIKRYSGSVPQSEEELVVYDPGPPSPAIESTATIAATGDILLHESVLAGALTEDGYDFSTSFEKISAYWSAYDYMIVNLEVPCGGEESGEYSGYPTFNAPDDIVYDLADAGVDMFLTANNHAYDRWSLGLTRTQEVIQKASSERVAQGLTELDNLGTRLSTSENYVKVKDVNGIKFGFACYTYDTREYADSVKSLNGIEMDEESANLVNSFCYSDLETLYASIASDISYMESQECDVTVFFMHWGNEYTDEPNEYETEISQKLCDLGADIIIGGHPHVIQKFDVLQSSNDGSLTYCLYSTGNTLSAQRKELMNEDGYRGYTEDGLTISFSYYKFNNGKVKIKEVYVLPTWVEKSDDVYEIIPLEQTIKTDKWQTNSVTEAIDSFNRTLGRVGSVYPELRGWLGNDEVKTYIEN